ncbi:MAG: transposase [Candidatus Daviesbacteria bacterium]|nr:transposase [Candidatus Daviesbacteria bacterium]
MASRNSVKDYSMDSYYHIYNRGVEKRLIFMDDQDYAVFLSYLRTYLMPKDIDLLKKQLSDSSLNSKEKDKIFNLIKMNNFADEITLYCYCLMPNHFHFLVKQKSANSIDKFMNSLGVRYTLYFNRKYKRVGSLYQDVYKAVMVYTDEQLLNITHYIHKNPVKDIPQSKFKKLASEDKTLHAYFSQPSSYPEYLGLRQTPWVHCEEILSFFSIKHLNLSYQNFMEEGDDIDLFEF